MLCISKKEISVKKPKEPIKTVIPPVKTGVSTDTSKKKKTSNSRNVENEKNKQRTRGASIRSTISASTSYSSSTKTDKDKSKPQSKISSASSSGSSTSSQQKMSTQSPRKRKAGKVNNRNNNENSDHDIKSSTTSKAATVTAKTKSKNSQPGGKIEILKKSTPAKKKVKNQNSHEVLAGNIEEVTTNENVNSAVKETEKEKQEIKEQNSSSFEEDSTNKPPIFTRQTILEFASLFNNNDILPVEKQSGIFEEIKEGQQRKHNVGGRSVFRHRSSICLYKEGYGPGHALEGEEPLITKNGRPVFNLALNESTVSFLDNSRNTSGNNFLEMSSGLIPHHPKSKYNFSIPLDDTNDMSQTAAMLKDYIFDENNEWNTTRTEPNHQEHEGDEEQHTTSQRQQIPNLRLSLGNTIDDSMENSFLIPSAQATDRSFLSSNFNGGGGRTSTRLSFLYNKNTGIICKNCFSSTCCHMEKFSLLATENANKLIDNSEGIDANSSDITVNRSTFRSDSSLQSFGKQEYTNKPESIDELKQLFDDKETVNNGNESMRLVGIQNTSHTDQSGNVIPFQELQVELELNFETSTPNDEQPSNEDLNTGLDMSNGALLYTPAVMKADDMSLYSRPTTNDSVLQYDSDYDDASYLNACKGSANTTFEQLDVTTGVYFCNSQNNSSSEDVSVNESSLETASQPESSSGSLSNSTSNDNRRSFKPHGKAAKRRISVGLITNLDTVFEGEESSARSAPSTAFIDKKNKNLSGLADLLDTVDIQLSSRSGNKEESANGSNNEPVNNNEHEVSKVEIVNNKISVNPTDTELANKKKIDEIDQQNQINDSAVENDVAAMKRQEFQLEDFQKDSLDEGVDDKQELEQRQESTKNSQNNNLITYKVETSKESIDNINDKDELGRENEGEETKQLTNSKKEIENENEEDETEPQRSFRRIQDKDGEILQHLSEDELQLWLQANRKNCFEKDFFQDDIRYNNEDYNNAEMLPEDREVLEINTPEWEKKQWKKAEKVTDTEMSSQVETTTTRTTSESNPGTGDSIKAPTTQGSYRHIDMLVIERRNEEINNELPPFVDTESNHSDDSGSAIDSGVHSTSNTHSSRTLPTEEGEENNRNNDRVRHHEIDALVFTTRTRESVVEAPGEQLTTDREPHVTLPIIDSIRLAKQRDAYKNSRNRLSDCSERSIPSHRENFSFFDYPREITSPMLEHHKKMAQYHRERIELLTPLVHGADSPTTLQNEHYQPKPPSTPPHLKKSHKRSFAKINSPPIHPTNVNPPPLLNFYGNPSSYLDNLNNISPRTKPFVPHPPSTFDKNKRFTRKSNRNDFYTQVSKRKNAGNPYYDEPEYQNHVSRINSRAFQINKQRQLMRRQINTYAKTIDPKYDTTLYLTVPFRSLNLKQHPKNIYSESNRPLL